MRLVSATVQKSLLAKVRAAHDKVVRAAVDSDLLGLAMAFGQLAHRGQVPSEYAVREMVKAGVVRVDREVVEHARGRLRDGARTVRDRVVSKVRAALLDGSATLRRQGLSGKKDLAKARRAAADRAIEVVEKALVEAARDWELAVDSVVHEVLDEGRASEIVKSAGDDPLVYKDVRSDCCAYCRVLYTVDGSKPRVFRLSELVDNGSNVGRRAGRPVLKGENATEYRPVLGGVHPRCRCPLRAATPEMGASSRDVVI